ncbi:MAG: BrnT family toxin [Planctomycetes bacterium]|nr:BrnT family toxin [Planctomycetota bacterium]
MSLRFEWDPRKAMANERKHGVTFLEASTVFADPLASTIPDPRHSDDEDRFVTLGASRSARLLVVSYTERGDTIRIVGARVATRRERKAYEEAEVDEA